MIKKHIFLLVIFLFSISISQAKEGMWIPYLISQLNADDMKAMGMEISPDDIYSVNHSSLKDAIVHFNLGCTAELISSKGLLLTNHHCGYSQIQSHSSLENNYLKDGFWAMSQEQELKNPGLIAAIIKYMEDVTDEALAGVSSDLDMQARDEKIKANIDALLEERNKETDYDLSVKPFFYGNQYILIAREIFKDVRLVGAPPSSIGKYGADTDNWMWPRHTGDFSIFRIYANKDNLPADVSDENVPYKPVQHLKINVNGFKPNDFTMVYGFPGSTQEYLPSTEVANIINVYNPARIAIRDVLLETLDAKMRKDEATRIKYAAKYAGISNSWKRWKGEILGLRETKGVEKKERLEEQFSLALLENPELNKKYGNVLPNLKELYEERKPYMLERYHYIEIGYFGIELLHHLLSYRSIVSLSGEELKEKAAQRAEGLEESFYKDYDASLDMKAAVTLLPVYLNQVKTEPIPEIIKELKEMDQEDQEEYIRELFEESIVLEDPAEWRELLANNPEKAIKKLKKDEAYKLSLAMIGHYFEALNASVKEIDNKIEYLQGQYVMALQEVLPLKKFYPDANSTLRVAYGKVQGYEPKDAVVFNPQTYLSGVIAKYIPGDYEFDLPQKLIDLYESKDYGRWGEGGKMPVCFIASNHTTGGNSGSPALNARGELIGLNFDRAWEGTMSDMNYDISRCRNIMVDIRYVLFIVDKFAGASYLINELDLAESTKEREAAHEVELMEG